MNLLKIVAPFFSIFLYPDAPICHPNNQRKYGVLVGETVRITCTVIANPHVERFRWWYTEMGKRREFEQHDFTIFPQRNFSYSVLNFT